MNLRTIALIITVALIVFLAAFNWTTLNTPTEISIGVTSFSGPLGLLMLMLTILLTVVFLGYTLYQQGSMLVETRRHNKEMAQQRELADKAEASRFSELRNFLESQQTHDDERSAREREAIIARVAELEQRLQQRVEQSDNATAAYMGELGDRLTRTLPGNALRG